MNQILQELSSLGIIPVIAIDNAQDAEPLARALVDGGLPCAEVTFRTAAARESIARIAKAFPAMHLGAGTVLTIDQVKAAVESGAKYIVSPGINPKTVEYCLSQNIPVTPGIATPTEIEMALELGLEVVKFFPAEPLGGIPYLKAIAAPYKALKFIPTGGVDESNLLAYLKLPNVLACGGSWMVKADLINAKRFDEIQRLTSQAVVLRGSLKT
jgi:2-dehydro-3-deoxyphosphogluconate aldolase/(4S)-4-hydroxy-2-oxoglutarate aldolase